ncbi:MAG: hypothetical protein HN411_06765 [Waddliaceae bacterium]|jgi:hypothetical protein|nr:hypothetical protein [Waddliaceae bacterium]MBT3578417.1 hypothetical protein [Waddliaceae bacterium]MBT4445269.1 hypothetical protein [Waddliaceae bacterium]MBT6929133.1 hypothetical protein [Waddliaceae bacterium]MBT7264632.1 hypothetical protein [Waddliaceae bacterium]
MSASLTLLTAIDFCSKALTFPTKIEQPVGDPRYIKTEGYDLAQQNLEEDIKKLSDEEKIFSMIMKKVAKYSPNFPSLRVKTDEDKEEFAAQKKRIEQIDFIDAVWKGCIPAERKSFFCEIDDELKEITVVGKIFYFQFLQLVDRYRKVEELFAEQVKKPCDDQDAQKEIIETIKTEAFAELDKKYVEMKELLEIPNKKLTSKMLGSSPLQIDGIINKLMEDGLDLMDSDAALKVYRELVRQRLLQEHIGEETEGIVIKSEEKRQESPHEFLQEPKESFKDRIEGAIVNFIDRMGKPSTTKRIKARQVRRRSLTPGCVVTPKPRKIKPPPPVGTTLSSSSQTTPAIMAMSYEVRDRGFSSPGPRPMSTKELDKQRSSNKGHRRTCSDRTEYRVSAFSDFSARSSLSDLPKIDKGAETGVLYLPTLQPTKPKE